MVYLTIIPWGCVGYEILFNFHTLYEFQFSDWLICTTWHWVMTQQPPWRHYRGVITVVLILYTTVITPWLRPSQSLTIFVCSVFNLNNKNVNALTARELSGFTCPRSLTMNEKFQFSFIVIVLLISRISSVERSPNLLFFHPILQTFAAYSEPIRKLELHYPRLRI